MRAPALEKKRVTIPQGTIAYLEAGAPDAPTILFVHGIPTSSYLWRNVMRALEDRFHCLALDLPGLGDTEVDPDRTDFAMPAQARVLEDFLDALGIARAHVVAHDQGGAAAQILVTTRPSRVERLVLTDVVCFDNWPVPLVAGMQAFARLPFIPEAAARIGLVEAMGRPAFRRGVSDRRCFTNEAIAEYLRPLRGDRAARQRFQAFLLAGRARYTMAVVDGLRELTVPTLILWAAEDRYIPPAWGRRLYETIGSARRFEVVGGCGHFWQEERPDAFAERIGAFLSEEEARKRDEPIRVARVAAAKCPDPPARRRAAKQEAKS